MRTGRITTLFPVSEKYPDSSRLPVVPFERSKRALIDEKWGDSSIEFRLRPNATATGVYSRHGFLHAPVACDEIIALA